MNSTIAWLDTTAEEQRRARELIEFFTQQESRDELGTGQIRDAFSDMLFPGISVSQRRARYYLFVPWCYSRGSARGKSGDTCRAKGETQERRLINALIAAKVPESGLIGKVAGAAVKTLPSAVYWPGYVGSTSSPTTRTPAIWAFSNRLPTTQRNSRKE